MQSHLENEKEEKKQEVQGSIKNSRKSNCSSLVALNDEFLEQTITSIRLTHERGQQEVGYSHDEEEFAQDRCKATRSDKGSQNYRPQRHVYGAGESIDEAVSEQSFKLRKLRGGNSCDALKKECDEQETRAAHIGQAIRHGAGHQAEYEIRDALGDDEMSDCLPREALVVCEERE